MARPLIVAAALVCLGAGRGLGAGHAPQADRVVIPAGPFTQGSTRGDEDERPAHKVTLKAFSIDRTEVTRGDYAACVAAKRCKAPPRPVPADDASSAKLPVTDVD